MKRFFSLILLACLCSLTCACSDNSATENRTDLEFTVVAPDQIPSELLQILETKKESNFALTYSDGSWLYIALGAGKQPTGGYSYSINGLWLGENAIHIDADLLGPSANEQTTKVPSYPYVVIKLEHRDEPVVFQ